MSISLRARIVFPVDRPPLAGGVVTIDGERIVAVEPASRASGPVQDLGDVALLPGLVNAHTHLEFSHLRQPLGRPGMRLVDWLPLAIAERQNRSDAAAESITAGIDESALAGTCALGEIATADPAASLAREAVAVLPFLEVIGFSRARAESALAAVAERLAAASSVLPVGLSPHAPYTVSPELLVKLVQLAEDRKLPVAMHLAESAEELELLATGTGPFRDLLDARSMWDASAIPSGSRPIDYLRVLARAPRSLVVHGNHLASDEHEFLAAHADRMTLVYCPRTHAYFDHPPHPLSELLAAGVNVALGTDSRASNPDLSMLREMRHAASKHPDVAPESILEMATLAAARALGLGTDFGSITPGKLGNFVALRAGQHAKYATTTALSALLLDVPVPTSVWLRGREVGRSEERSRAVRPASPSGDCRRQGETRKGKD